MEARPCLIVCTTCRAGARLADGETPQGALLHAALAGRPGVDVVGTTCMANCERGCSAALSMPGKWTIFLGHLSPAHAADLVTYAALYAASATGTVMPSRRPASLASVVLGRIPALEQAA